MINVRQQGNQYIITFKYDPQVIEIVKSVPGRRWDPNAKCWLLPADKLGWLINAFRGTIYESYVKIQSEEDININTSLDPTTKIPDIDISKIPFYVKEGAKPYQHQLDFMKFAIYRQTHGNSSGFLLADDMGLGKSLETINLAIWESKQYKIKHCLVLCCINSSKYNWQRDISDHTNGQYQGYIIGSRKKRNGEVRCDTGSAEKLEDLKLFKQYGSKGTEELPFFIIMNIEAVRYQVGKKYPLADKIIELINNGTIGMVAVDEIHKNVSPSSKQGKQIQRIKKETKSRALWLPLTGTPITNKPTDVFLPMYLTDSHHFTSYYMWCKEFCLYGGFGDHEIVGYKNIPKLKMILQGNMLRRMKEDVLDLPPKIYFTRYVDNTPYQQRLYDEIREGIMRDRSKILDKPNPLAQFLRLRQANGSPELVDPNCKLDSDYFSKNAKIAELFSILEEVHERGEKVVVFSNWVEPLRTLYRFVSKRYKTCAFTGTMSDEDKEKNKHVFMTNPEYTVLLGTIGAAGTTHTFTSANNLVFYDSPWNPSDRNQASDRLYRIGTKSTVNIYTLITRNTVDERVQDILYAKEGTANYIVDNKIDLRNNPGLFDMLLK